MKTNGALLSKPFLGTCEEGKEREKQNWKQGNSKRTRGFQRSLYSQASEILIKKKSNTYVIDM